MKMEKLDRDRISTIKTALMKLSDLERANSEQTIQNLEKVFVYATKINEDQDLSEFVKQCLPVGGAPPIPEPPSYLSFERSLSIRVEEFHSIPTPNKPQPKPTPSTAPRSNFNSEARKLPQRTETTPLPSTLPSSSTTLSPSSTSSSTSQSEDLQPPISKEAERTLPRKTSLPSNYSPTPSSPSSLPSKRRLI